MTSPWVAGGIGLVLGAFWTAFLLSEGAQIQIEIGLIQPILMGAFFAPGLVLAAMLILGAIRRTGSQADAPASGRADSSALIDTLAQIALALCLWPLVGFVLGAGTVLVLGLGFAVARLVYWLGCHHSILLRSIGFSATLLPTVVAALLALWRFVT